MGSIKSLLSSWKIWLYIVFFVITILAINPNPFNEGVAIRTVALNSSAYNAGMQSPSPSDAPMSRERILRVNNIEINSVEEFDDIVSTIPANSTLTIRTSKSAYSLLFTSKEKLGLTVYEAPKSNIILGLDLQGGTRVVLRPEQKLSAPDMDILLENMKRRIDVFGLTDTVVRTSSDLAGSQFIIIEVAGANEEEVKDLLAKQGKFEAKIGNDTVFLGGNDITYVCRTADCSRIETCQQYSDGYGCRFIFSISLSTAAAERQADVTRNMDVNVSEQGYQYLEKPLDLYLDNNSVDSLNIAADLKGKAARDIVISGPGVGATQEEALEDANDKMKKLQTVLITGALPTSLEIVKLDSISPTLGSTFEKNALTAALFAILAVAVVIFIRYRKLKISLPMIFISLSEALITLGILTMMKYNLDLAAIAGIIAAVGTGVDDQIVITDEILSKESMNWRERYKKAFFIIFIAYLTAVVSMIPLLMAGVGLLKGFALSTIIGVTIGVFVTRPAYAHIIKVLLNE